MNKAPFLFAVAVAVAAGPITSAYADRVAERVAERAPDTTGWTLLGQQDVGGKRDRDTIVVGKYEGRFDQIQLVVLDSDIELKDLTVIFTNGEKWSPGLKSSFREGQRSRALDLPGNNRQIAKIELAYSNTPGGGKAKVAVYGRDKMANNGPRPGGWQFDAKGWTLLGKSKLPTHSKRAQIDVPKYVGAIDQLTMVITDADVEIRDFEVNFATRDPRWSLKLNHTFKEGTRSRVIDLPTKDRTLARIAIAYTPINGNAKVELYGRDANRPAPPQIKPVVWENKGWTYLGKSTVDGWRDRDKINVNQASPFTEVMFVVGGSDVLLNSVVVTLGNNEKFEMKQPIAFKEGTRTAPIDIPGKLRKIRSVEFAYANLPGGGRAQVEVWARKKGDGAPPLPPNGNPGPLPPRPTQAPPPPAPPPPVVRDHRK